MYKFFYLAQGAHTLKYLLNGLSERKNINVHEIFRLQ